MSIHIKYTKQWSVNVMCRSHSFLFPRRIKHKEVCSGDLIFRQNWTFWLGVIKLGHSKTQYENDDINAKLKVFYVRFFYRKKGMLVSYQSPSVVCLSARPGVRPSVTFVANVSPPKLLYIATQTLYLDRSHDVEGTGQHFVRH